MATKTEQEGAAAPETPIHGERRGEAPQGWTPGQVEKRFAGAKAITPSTYNAEERSVEIVIATEYRVRRWFGWEELAIRSDAIDLKRVAAGKMPLLDSHDQYGGRNSVLGFVRDVRVEGNQLVGKAYFADTDAGRQVEQMVARGEMTGISAGYRINKLILTERNDDEDDVYRAEEWELLEASLVSVPADPFSGARSEGGAPPPPASPQPAAGISLIEAARVRMRLAAAAITARIRS